MITQQQIIEQEIASKSIEIFQLKLKLAHFSNENEKLREQISKASENKENINCDIKDSKKSRNGPTPIK